MDDPSLLELFRAEVAERCAELGAGLADDALWTGGPGHAREALSAAAHSIRGAARVVGLTEAEKLAAALEQQLGVLARTGATPTAALLTALRSAHAWFAGLCAAGAEQLDGWEVEHPTAGVLAAIADAALAPAAQVSRPAARQTQPPSADTAMLELFRVETQAHARALNEGLLALERNPAARDRLDALMRAAHSIKGAARIVGFGNAVRLTHALEDCLTAARKGRVQITPAVIDTLLGAVDLLEQLAEAPAERLESWLRERDAAVNDMAARVARLMHEPQQSGVMPVPAPVLPPVAAAPAAAAPVAATPVAVPPPPTPPNPAPVVEPDELVDDREVRLSATSINRILAMSGEARVQARRLHELGDGLRRVMTTQAGLTEILDQLHHAAVLRSADAYVIDTLRAASSTARECRLQVGERLAELDAHSRRSEDLTDRLYRQSVASRMRPFGDSAHAFPRMVRDLARSLGKQVELVVAGESVGVDRDILDRLEAPLGHMLRNAIDHGLESPAERVAAGKPERGAIRLEARHWAGMLSIRISDDGRGIDPARVRAALVAKGLADAAGAAAMSEQTVLEQLFRPGFSTAEQITDISGRGVGLDVVQSMIREVGGTLRLTSEPGKGTQFQLQLPITLSVMRAVLVLIAGDHYAFPLSRVRRMVYVPLADVRALEGQQFFVHEGENVSLVGARELLELEGGAGGMDPLCVVVVGERGAGCGLVVDRFTGEQDIVVRPLDRRLGKVADISAATTTVDGTPMLILDVEDLLRSVARLTAGGMLGRVGVGGGVAGPSGARLRKRVLVVDDSLTVREVERQLLANRGYEVVTAVDGVDAWESIHRADFDLVVTDVDMPRMDGIELVRSIKQDPRLRATPVMIVSYRDREEDRMRGLEAGANYYLTKSNFHDAALLQAVLDLIGEPEGEPA